jgi:hypothetical protein
MDARNENVVMPEKTLAEPLPFGLNGIVTWQVK